MPTPTAEAHLHHLFVALVLPRVLSHARIRFRHVRCADRRSDIEAEMAALSWSWFLRLTERGRNPSEFPSALAYFAARQVNSGRRLCGQDAAADVMSPRTRSRHEFGIRMLSDRGGGGDDYHEALQDNSRSPVPDQVAFRLDFPAWRKTRTARDRRIMAELMRGGRTHDVAAKFGLSAGRVSQLRRDFLDDWRAFTGEAEAGVTSRRDAGVC